MERDFRAGIRAGDAAGAVDRTGHRRVARGAAGTAGDAGGELACGEVAGAAVRDRKRGSGSGDGSARLRAADGERGAAGVAARNEAVGMALRNDANPRRDRAGGAGFVRGYAGGRRAG